MPSFPEPGSLTICEINRDFITADDLSDEKAKETYGKLIGFVFSPIPFRCDNLLADLDFAAESDQQEQQFVRPVWKGGFDALKEKLSQSFKHVFSATDNNVIKEVDHQGVSWHPHKNILAFISGRNQVILRDYDNSADGKDPCILTSEFQRDITTLKWRPNSGKMLSVASKGGICIWSASYPGNVAPLRSGVISSHCTVSGGAGVRWILVDLLKSPNGEQINALCWSPDGRYLASASYQSSSFTIWDVAQGKGTPIRRGLGAVSLLQWSPNGDYFLTAKFDGTFYLWETNTWTSEPWSSSSGYVTGAAWDPEGRMVLLAFSGSATLGSVHLSSRFPSLDAHLLPVELPEITLLIGSHGIEKLAWDASGERLALAYNGGDEVHKGLIAIYDVKRTPLISLSLVGFIRGPGENPKPITFSFHDKFKQGPLLSVCWSSGFCCTYPLIFRSHVLP